MRARDRHTLAIFASACVAAGVSAAFLPQIAEFLVLWKEVEILGFGSGLALVLAHLLVGIAVAFVPLSLGLEWLCRRYSKWLAVIPPALLVVALVLMVKQKALVDGWGDPLLRSLVRITFWIAFLNVYCGVLGLVHLLGGRPSPTKGKKKPAKKKQKRGGKSKK